MPQPIDLSQVPAPSAPRPKSSFQRGGGRRRGTPLFEYARKVFWGGLVVSLILLAYLLAGLYSGAWSHHNLAILPKADYQRQIDNINLVFSLLQMATLVTVVSLLIITYRDEGIGYSLLLTGVALYAGLPALTAGVYSWRVMQPSAATQTLMRDFQLLAWAFLGPGLLWTLWDLARRFRNAAETAAIQRANLKYGANVKQQPKVVRSPRWVFSRCWELPYCRDNIREKCPIYIQKRGPCWWHKEGCMCEERIILQAVINTDWKQKAARANMALNIGQTRSGLSPEAKRQRCRNCVIYNEHQRQKYKALVTVALLVMPVLLYMNGGVVQGWAVSLLSGMDAIMERFSFSSRGPSISLSQAGPLHWTLIGALCVILMAQVLKFIEYWCFKLKI